MDSAHDGLTQRVDATSPQRVVRPSPASAAAAAAVLSPSVPIPLAVATLGEEDLRIDVADLGGFLDESPSGNGNGNGNGQQLRRTRSPSETSEVAPSTQAPPPSAPPSHVFRASRLAEVLARGESRVMGTDKAAKPATAADPPAVPPPTAAAGAKSAEDEFSFQPAQPPAAPADAPAPPNSKSASTSKSTFLGKTLDEDEDRPPATGPPKPAATKKKITTKPPPPDASAAATTTTTTTTTEPPLDMDDKAREREEKLQAKQHQRDLRESEVLAPEDLWNFVWPWMKREGWSHRAGSGMVDWYYLAPGVKSVADGVVGTTVLTSAAMVADWVRQNSPTILHEAMEDYRAKFAPAKHKGSGGGSGGSGGGGNSFSSQASSAPSSRNMKHLPLDDIVKFDPLWKWLKTQGWTHKKGRGLVSWYYILPGHVKEGGQRGVDYLPSEEKLYEFLALHKEYLKGYILEDGKDLSEVDFLVPNVNPATQGEDVSPPSKRSKKQQELALAAGGAASAAAAAVGAAAPSPPARRARRPAPAASPATAEHRGEEEEEEEAKEHDDSSMPPHHKRAKKTPEEPHDAPPKPVPAVSPSVNKAKATAAATTTTTTETTTPLPHPTSPRINSNLLKGRFFALSGFEEKSGLKKHLETLLQGCGATLVNPSSSQWLDGTLPDFVTLSRPTSYRTERFLLAASLGRPCLHYRWVLDSIQAASLKRVEDYALPRGLLLPIGDGGGGFPTLTFSPPHCLKPFSDKRFVVQGSRNFSTVWKGCLVNMGAVQVDTYSAGASIPDGAICLVETETALELDLSRELLARAERHPNIVTATPSWATQCIMSGMFHPITSRREFQALPSATTPLPPLPEGFAQRKIPPKATDLFPGAPPHSNRPVEILGEWWLEDSSIVTFSMVRLGQRRYEVGDYVFSRPRPLTHELFYLGSTAMGAEGIPTPSSSSSTTTTAAGTSNGPTVDHYSLGQITGMFLDPASGVPRIRLRVLFRDAHSQVLFDTGITQQAFLDGVDDKFACVVVTGTPADAAKVVASHAVCKETVVGDFRDRVYVLCQPPPAVGV